MDLALFGRYFLDFALLYPSAFLCLASLWEKLRTCLLYTSPSPRDCS